MERVRTPVLEVAYESTGSPNAYPVVLLHGFPYDPRCFDDVVRIITAKGFRAIVP
jgi:pimeloyl-ACP methyl ester carboxylesterase